MSAASPSRRGLPDLSPKAVVAVVFVTSMFMTVLDSTIVNVALPTIATDFHVSESAGAGVNVGYLVSLAVFISAAGWLGDRFGTKRVFLVALAIFTAASALCGLAWNLPSLVGFRVLQGVGGGMLTPVGMAMMMRVFPPAERMRASRYLIVPTALAPACGPIVGGLLVDHLSWHWVFYINVPFGAAAFVFGALFLTEGGEEATGPFDLPGFLLSGIGLASVLYALTEGSARGWASPLILGLGLGGLVLLGALVVVETRTPHPLLDLGLYRNGLFRWCTLVTTLSSAGFLGTVFVLPLEIQRARDLSAVDSGLTTFPTAVGIMVATQLVSRYYPRVGPRRLAACGLVGVAGLIASLALVGAHTSLWWVRGALFLTGLCLAHVFMPSQTAAFATVDNTAMGGASTLFNVQRQLGAAVGVAVLGSVLAAVGPFSITATGPRPNFAAYHWAFLAAAAMILLGAVCALFISDADAAPTMVPPGTSADETTAHEIPA